MEPLMISTSTLEPGEVKELQSLMEKEELGRVVSNWRDNISYLVISQLTLTVKVANALAKGIPIVKPDFFADFVTSIDSQQVLPDPKSYIPPLAEGFFNKNEVDLAVNKQRQKV